METTTTTIIVRGIINYGSILEKIMLVIIFFIPAFSAAILSTYVQQKFNIVT